MTNEVGAVVARLSPRVTTTVPERADPLPMALVSRAMSSPGSLDRAEALAVGRALMLGEGAPPNEELALSLLLPLVEEGDPQALDILGRRPGLVDPVRVYAAAVDNPAPDASFASFLDRLETRMTLAQVLEAQTTGGSRGFDGITRPEDLRDRALAHLSGLGAVRSYGDAAYWARLAVAADDETGRDILEDLDLRMSGGDASEAWEAVRRTAADDALSDWVSADLPARLSGARCSVPAFGGSDRW